MVATVNGEEILRKEVSNPKRGNQRSNYPY
jgi:hypothetical protein